jgi:hypothetical protein
MCGNNLLRCEELYITGHEGTMQTTAMFVGKTVFVTEHMNITILYVSCFVWRAIRFAGRRTLSY